MTKTIQWLVVLIEDSDKIAKTLLIYCFVNDLVLPSLYLANIHLVHAFCFLYCLHVLY